MAEEVFDAVLKWANDYNKPLAEKLSANKDYVTAILKDAKLFFLGKGFSNVKLNDRGSHSTPIQSIYQFGVVGLPILLFWIVCFFRDTSRVGITGKRFTLNLLMVIVGVLLPWIAIDILFFDDFFLLQWYLFIAMQQPQLRGWSNDEILNNSIIIYIACSSS